MLSSAYVGGGCFWCIEAVLQRLKGVQSVESGYAGGHTLNPTYDEICMGKTGHAEIVKVNYNPQTISYYGKDNDILDLIYIFMNLHDPTTLNRQGYDQGTQYRSIILYQSEEEKEVISKVFSELK